jgi:uncharacterized HAD superfamily protein
MEQVTVSVDLDGTLADFMTPALTAVNLRFGSSYSYQDIIHHDAKTWMPSDHHDHFMEFVRDPEVYGRLDPLPEGIEVVLGLAERDCSIVITSHRPPAALRPTRDWLLRHGVPYSQLSVSYGSKAALAEGYGPTRPLIFLDDDPSLVLALDLPREGIEVWLLKTPYTGSVGLDRCRVFPDWTHLQAALFERLQPASVEL